MQLEVDRNDLHRTRVLDDPAPDGPRLRVEKFALTSNNITYAAFGDMLQYWNFFPAATEDGVTWGRVPVWGFATAEGGETGVDGRQVYGYLPMGTHFSVEPGRVDAGGWTDTAEHRRPMASAYSRYRFTETDPIYAPDREAQQMVLYPLFFTSFVIDDFLADDSRSGASTVLLSSASSKTAIGTAFLLSQRTGLTVVGLTSPGNADFVKSLGCYHETIAYSDLSRLPAGDAMFVDIAGNGDVRNAVHGHYGDRLAHSMIVGSTHWDTGGGAPPPDAGPTPEFFFAPTQISKLTHDLGQDGVDKKVGDAWRSYLGFTDGWLTIEEHAGPKAVEAVYQTLLEGRVDPRVGFACTMEET